MFKKILLLILLFLVVVTSIYAAPTSMYPEPKFMQTENTSIDIGNKFDFNSSKRFFNKYKASVNSLKNSVETYGKETKNPIYIEIFKMKDLSRFEEKYRSDLNKTGAYVLEVAKTSVRVSAKSDEGLLNGLSTLEAIIEEKKGSLNIGTIIDYPDLKMRVLHISMWPCTIDDFKKTIRLARLEHFNTLIWLNHFGVKLKSLEHLKISNKNRWSIKQFKEMVKFVKQNGLEIIPELKLLSHQKKFLGDAYPQYMYNKATYDPRKQELYTQVVFPAIDELLELTGATKFHIGHDEVAGWNEWFYRKKILNTDDKQLPPELFLQDITILHEHLSKKQIETWMWSDMLYTKKEFPSMKKAGANLNGMNGYASIRGQIPKDIVMNVWHYQGEQTNFSTAKKLADDGHKVLGATSKSPKTTVNFARYIANMDENAEGMIATTWYGLTGKKKEKVREIIQFSGRAFWNAK